LYRKGLAAQWVVMAIFVLLCFAAIFFSISYFFDKASELESIGICRASVLLRDTAENVVTRDMSPLLCNTFTKTVPSNTDDGEAGVKREMADMVKSCWYMFGNGMVPDVFNNWFGSGLTNDCFVCYIVKIDDNSVTMNADEFVQYMDQTYVTKKQYDKDDNQFKDVEVYTYTGYVQGSGGKGSIAMDQSLTFQPGRPYAIAFASPDFLSDNEVYQDIVSKITGTPKWPYIVISDYNSLSSKCEIVEDEV